MLVFDGNCFKFLKVEENLVLIFINKKIINILECKLCIFRFLYFFFVNE